VVRALRQPRGRHYAKGVVLLEFTAVIIAFGGVGGIFATTVFRQQDYPKYLPGLWATMACQFFNLVLLAITTMYFTHKNNQVREGKVKELEGREGFLYTI
jgi:succinate dehydrogenase hydrophobic anchor subunit